MKTIQPFVQQIVEAMSAVLGVEITVIDKYRERIAGTGRFRQEIGNKIPNSFILSKALRNRTYYIIDNPGENVLCKDCLNYKHCIETAIIVLPISSQQDLFGAMCLVAFDEKQRRKLLMEKQNLLSFITYFSELISSKAREQKLIGEITFISKQLQKVIDAVNEGIIVFNKEGDISLINSYVKTKITPEAERKFVGKCIKDFIAEIPLDPAASSNHINGFRKGLLEIDNSSFQIIYSLVPVQTCGKTEATILVFHISEDINKLIDTISKAKDLVTFSDLLGSSNEFLEAKVKAQIAAKGDSTILLVGESGTGKELFARAIHSASKRNKGPFVAINCAAIPNNLLESELFGYEGGAFTGARREGKPGKFELADGGTILLDEVGDMPMEMQAKLLRVLEDRSIERVGGTKSVKVDVRVIASTSRNIEEMIEKGKFRSDLFYRISTIPIFLPPLRRRKEDIPIYVDYFLRGFNSKLGKNIKGFTREAEKMLMAYDWPGNVRELKNVVEYAVNMENSTYIRAKNLPDRVKIPKIQRNPEPFPLSLREREERKVIIEALAKFGKTTEGKKLAAKELNISLATLYRKIKKYNISPI